jgi:hypothetical protein
VFAAGQPVKGDRSRKIPLAQTNVSSLKFEINGYNGKQKILIFTTKK